MQDEIKSLKENNTRDLVEKPKGVKVVGGKWIFRIKEGIPRVEKPRYKARLVARGYSQREGVDFNEIYAPVVKHRSIRVVLSLVAHNNLELEQLDVKTAFLYGEIDETIYITQPECFVIGDAENNVCLLKKSLYSLKQSPRQWYKKFDEFMLKCGFNRSSYDWCIYYKFLDNDSVIYPLLYVDDMLIASDSMHLIDDLKKQLSSQFEMKDLGPANKILGMQIVKDRTKGTLFLNQTGYLTKLVNNVEMSDAKSVLIPIAHHFKLSTEQCPKNESEFDYMSKVPYANAVGCLMYAMVCTRPDLAHCVSMISRFMSKPGKAHWNAVKWVLIYVKGSLDKGLMFGTTNMDNNSDIITGYVDSHFAGCIDTRKSQTGYVFNVYGTVGSWKAGLQPVVTLSTTEAEFVAVTEVVKEALWLKGVLAELKHDQKCVKIGCDSQGVIHLSKHQVFHERSKHIDVKLHFVREVIETGAVAMVKIDTEENPADMLTKPVPSAKFQLCLGLISLLETG
ncbi:unnamed protein product [Rhodiola kirilowii]